MTNMQSSNTASWDEDPRSIYRIMAAQQWCTLWKALQSKPGSDSKFFRPILHFVCRFHPPVEIVKLLDEKFPASLTSADKSGKYPIHFAAECGAPCSIIEYLAERDPSSAGKQDITGMTPTHFLCKYYKERHQPAKDSGRRTRTCMLDAMEALIQAAPSSLILEDEEEMNALEYAIESEVDYDVVRALQKACEEQCKKQANDLKEKKRTESNVDSSMPKPEEQEVDDDRENEPSNSRIGSGSCIPKLEHHARLLQKTKPFRYDDRRVKLLVSRSIQSASDSALAA